MCVRLPLSCVVVAVLCLCASALGSEGEYEVRWAGEYSPEMLENVVLSLEHNNWISASGQDEQVKEAAREHGWDVKILARDRPSTLSYVAVKGNVVVVCFRGTKDPNSTWKTVLNAVVVDANVRRRRFDLVAPDQVSAFEQKMNEAEGVNKRQARKNKYKVRIHAGFYAEFADVRERIEAELKKHPNRQLIVTGFSLGGGLAEVACATWSATLNRPLQCYLNAAPRVGNLRWNQYYNSLPAGKRSIRTVLNGDPVPKLPWFRGYHHVGRLLQVNSNGTLVAEDAVNGRLLHKIEDKEKRSYHDKDFYIDAVKKLIKSCPTATPHPCNVKPGQPDPLAALALAEERSRRHTPKFFKGEQSAPTQSTGSEDAESSSASSSDM
eukprot:TRINITY_DN66273_c7_g8_i1.p1 TRINITY_DN66273_c7_g8~~TRINITY_DN66273_c7_g8_i1.p1  ORF type:complete len:389 (+),score=189.47 TRINITY_DN66273_c7_g8_i1:28-1167(+)